MATRFPVQGDFIQLDQLLKATGLCDSGGVAKQRVAEGQVKVDGVIETRKRAKLRPGQRVEFAGEVIELVAT
ncbi:MAG TPA: RNA-binding S4 domain-containing protein [Zoogloea sp.]|uniref:RNA-binding S4 domain-containing protein n=1 Tax=Zoogloea sp. TaxID=49181 RepID=UPI002B967EFD|nr:RNA-binding S4 domain-containing protein [Zoogloea sp.]HMV16378.1 RNA-binding S4 domain-containing protein [Rhodocyclaceae bacterium]HMV61742.1 RNA-binding S4 domain-containing protein [Rhodocyclaceae bacterium]HMW51166.1 RNA-binding S4 domain-containing protein [Rhodocyclaceae bacterium]HMY48365.1 RNA-binding S4 domain-containing protein [Rhodocyclaceae bacterium]HMZ76302.1 RNA-binding S4 domain-containing protein [Rhodocyclaceae bacterium]